MIHPEGLQPEQPESCKQQGTEVGKKRNWSWQEEQIKCFHCGQ